MSKAGRSARRKRRMSPEARRQKIVAKWRHRYLRTTKEWAWSTYPQHRWTGERWIERDMRQLIHKGGKP